MGVQNCWKVIIFQGFVEITSNQLATPNLSGKKQAPNITSIKNNFFVVNVKCKNNDYLFNVFLHADGVLK